MMIKHPLKFYLVIDELLQYVRFLNVKQQLESPHILYISPLILKFKNLSPKNIMDKNKYNTYYFSPFLNHQKEDKA